MCRKTFTFSPPLVLLIGLLTGCSEPHPAPPTLPRPTTTVAAILAGTVSGEVILDGENIRMTDVFESRIFSDGTGEIVANYPPNDVPPINLPIRIIGVTTASEIDVSRSEPL